MLTWLRHIFISSTILLSGCFLAESLPVDNPCDIIVDKKFIVPLSKRELFSSKLAGGHGYSNDLQANLRDSMFYFYCDYKTKVDFVFLGKVVDKGNDSTIFQISKVVSLVTEGLSDEDIDDYKKVDTATLVDVFQKNYINQLTHGQVKLYHDNQLLRDARQTKNGN